VLENGRALLASVVASQMELHARFGGVYPEVASRQHVLSIVPVVEQALTGSHLIFSDLDAIAVTRGPGLAGSLVVGVNMAKGLALGTGLPLVGVNHLEGHVYSPWVYDAGETVPPEPQFPLLALLVSGGHTELNLMNNHLTYQRLGSTLDDAAGEAFDKVARLLGLPYPGGPSIQRAAEEGDSNRFRFPRLAERDLTFLSGLKTAVLMAQTEEKPVAGVTWQRFQAAVVGCCSRSMTPSQTGAREIL
jgi:N6-L-threonylcarbamoyladenine synthase